jgi:hypothetical protein
VFVSEGSIMRKDIVADPEASLRPRLRASYLFESFELFQVRPIVLRL